MGCPVAIGRRGRTAGDNRACEGFVRRLFLGNREELNLDTEHRFMKREARVGRIQ